MSDFQANLAAGTSATSTAVAWMSQANEVASFLASVVAIVAGIFAIVHYYRTIRR